MEWSNSLEIATIHKRYKRFLADCELNSTNITAHVPNTGSMTSCWEPEWKCALSKSPNPDRKLPYTLELTHNGKTWIGVNTANANKLAFEWLKQGLIPKLRDYKTIIPEKKIGDSRIDFYLEDHDSKKPCYVEVKNVTLSKNNLALFPDAVSTRGQKHLKELMDLKEKGFEAAMLFVIQRNDVDTFSPAKDIDPKYSQLLKEAFEKGVDIYAVSAKISLKEIIFDKFVPINLD